MNVPPEPTPIVDERGAIRRTIAALEGDALDAYLQTLSDAAFYLWMEEDGGTLAWGG